MWMASSKNVLDGGGDGGRGSEFRNADRPRFLRILTLQALVCMAFSYAAGFRDLAGRVCCLGRLKEGRCKKQTARIGREHHGGEGGSNSSTGVDVFRGKAWEEEEGKGLSQVNMTGVVLSPSINPRERKVTARQVKKMKGGDSASSEVLPATRPVGSPGPLIRSQSGTRQNWIYSTSYTLSSLASAARPRSLNIGRILTHGPARDEESPAKGIITESPSVLTAV